MSNDDPIAFFFTWSTYGTWLPGDARGWVEYRRGFQLPDPIRELESKARMTEGACILTANQRDLVLHAVNCRTNHVHVVLSSTAHPKTIREQLKAWCTRRLKEQQAASRIPEQQWRSTWWAERGCVRWIFRESDLFNANEYVLFEQDNRDRFDDD